MPWLFLVGLLRLRLGDSSDIAKEGKGNPDDVMDGNGNPEDVIEGNGNPDGVMET